MSALNPVLNFVCVVVLFILHLYLSYDFYAGWWYSAAGLICIIALGFVAWGKNFIKMSGITLPLRDLPLVITTAICALALSTVIHYLIGTPVGIRMVLNSTFSYLHNVFYIINEEIILGSLVLFFLTHKCSLRPITSSFLLALLIVFAHWVLYKWYFRNPGLLETSTLCTLFFVAFLKNNLILRFEHIGYAWALHLGWMSVMFGTLHFYADGRMMTDLEKFNLYLGSPLVLTFSFALASASVLLFEKQQVFILNSLRLLRKPRD